MTAPTCPWCKQPICDHPATNEPHHTTCCTRAPFTGRDVPDDGNEPDTFSSDEDCDREADRYEERFL